MKNKLKTTSFWLGLSGALVVLISAISRLFGVNISSAIVEDIILSICSILICLGFVNKKTDSGKEETKEELLEEINDELHKDNKDDNK